MTAITPLPPRNCVKCGTEFTPKPGGYNARYCTKNCKIRVRSQKVTASGVRVGAETHYSMVIKKDPEKLRIHNERAQRNQRAVRAWLAEYKVSRGCIDCGYKQYACALQFDHTGPKTATISEIRSSRKRILSEIESGKCVIRCANCHSVKTWHEKNGRDHLPGFHYEVDPL